MRISQSISQSIGQSADHLDGRDHQSHFARQRTQSAWGPKCTTASQPQSLAIFWIASEIARNFCSEKQIWPFFIAKCIATATVSSPQKNRAISEKESLRNVWLRKQIADFNHKSSPGDGALRWGLISVLWRDIWPSTNANDSNRSDHSR